MTVRLYQWLETVFDDGGRLYMKRLAGNDTLLTDAHRQIANLLREMPATTAPEVKRLGLIGALRRVVDEEFGSAFDDVTWQVEPEAEQEARAITLLTAEVLFYTAREAIRNAARHGRGAVGAPLADCPRRRRRLAAFPLGSRFVGLLEDPDHARSGGAGHGT